MRKHLHAFLEHARRAAHSLPRFVQRELEDFLTCRLPAHSLGRDRVRDSRAHAVILADSAEGSACLPRFRAGEEWMKRFVALVVCLGAVTAFGADNPPLKGK